MFSGLRQDSGLAKLVKDSGSRIEHIVRREQEAVRSVRSLATSKELDDFIEALVKDLADSGERELAGLERTVKVIERSLGQKIPTVARETKAERESKKLVPKRRFKGTVPWSLLPDSLDEVNYIDGKRTICEITEALSAEYGSTEHAHVMKYLRDLEKLGLVSFVSLPAQ